MASREFVKAITEGVADLSATIGRIDQRIDVLIARCEKAELRVKTLETALEEISSYCDGRADVSDGPDGNPVPNSWMQVQQIADAALGRCDG